MSSCSDSKYSGGKSCRKKRGGNNPTYPHVAGGKKTKSKRKTKAKKGRKNHRKTAKKSFLGRLFKL